MVSCFTAGKIINERLDRTRPPVHPRPESKLKTSPSTGWLAARIASQAKPGDLGNGQRDRVDDRRSERRVRTRLPFPFPAVHGSIDRRSKHVSSRERTNPIRHLWAVTASPPLLSLSASTLAGWFSSGKRQHRCAWKGEARLGSGERRVGAPWVSAKILVFSLMISAAFGFVCIVMLFLAGCLLTRMTKVFHHDWRILFVFSLSLFPGGIRT